MQFGISSVLGSGCSRLDQMKVLGNGSYSPIRTKIGLSGSGPAPARTCIAMDRPLLGVRVGDRERLPLSPLPTGSFVKCGRSLLSEQNLPAKTQRTVASGRKVPQLRRHRGHPPYI